MCCCWFAGGGGGGADDALGLQNFPCPDTGKANYPIELTKLLSKQANWEILQLKAQLQEFLTA